MLQSLQKIENKNLLRTPSVLVHLLVLQNTLILDNMIPKHKQTSSDTQPSQNLFWKKNWQRQTWWETTCWSPIWYLLEGFSKGHFGPALCSIEAYVGAQSSAQKGRLCCLTLDPSGWVDWEAGLNCSLTLCGVSLHFLGISCFSVKWKWEGEGLSFEGFRQSERVNSRWALRTRELLKALRAG